MTWRPKQSHITGDLIVDGSIEAEQIKTDTLTANKFKGATQEQYFYKFDDINLTFNSYVTLHEFDMPTTELSLIKGRTIKVDWDGLISTGTTSTIGSTVYLYTEVQVPTDTPTFRGIAQATHDSFPAYQWQRVYLVGNYLNYFGVGQVGAINSYRNYRNLTFEEFYPLSELTTNGSFTGNVSGWTGVGGTLNSFYGSGAQMIQDSNADDAFFYQAITIQESGTYRLVGQYFGGASNSGGKIILSTSAQTDPNYVVFSRTGSTGSTLAVDTLVELDAGIVYFIGQATSTTNGQYAVFDNFSLKKTEQRTYVDISSSGGQVVPTGGSADLYHHPFGNAAAGSWAVVKTKTISLRTNAYSHYFNITSESYLGIEYNPFKCRIRARHLFNGDTIYTQDGSVKVKARMTGQQNT